MDVRAILFDLHHTLTETKTSVFEIIRIISGRLDFDLTSHSDEKLKDALDKSDRELMQYLVENNIDYLWGGRDEDWLPSDRLFLEALGFRDVSDDAILEFEKAFKQITRDSDWEYFTDDALQCVRSLYSMGYTLGICTRRSDNPKGLIERSKLDRIFKTIQWSGVPGYAKPSPFTLLEAAKEIKVNPRHCIFVGNYVHADVEAALRCEMVPILLTWANPDEATKAPEECIVLEKPSDIVKWMQYQNPRPTSSGI